MADLVINNKVSMEWEKRGFFVKNGIFFFGSKEYESSKGETIAVFFTTGMAFIFYDEDSRFTLKDMMQFAQKKGNVSDRFPCDYEDNYSVIARPYVGDGFINNKLISELGLEAYIDDIVARVKDLSDYDKGVDAFTGEALPEDY